ncbi:MAG: OmpA family protein [Phycisphaerae bacterium]|jgi:flagellar motor protein MotB
MSDEKGHDHKPKGGHGHGGGHGGGAHEEHEGAPEWLISFADNVALMMGFFVVLLALNMKPESAGAASEGAETGGASPSTEMLDWAIALREAFNNPVDIENPRPGEMELVARIKERMHDKGGRSTGEEGSDRDMRSINRGEYHAISGVVAFADDSIELDETGRETCADLARTFHGLRNVVEVRGHVSAAEAYHLPDRGMSLAYDRAMVVARELVRNGMTWQQLCIVANADNERARSTSYSAADHRASQRVEIVETPNSIRDD